MYMGMHVCPVVRIKNREIYKYVPLDDYFQSLFYTISRWKSNESMKNRYNYEIDNA